MKIEDCRIDQRVRTKAGYEGKITGIWPDQVRVETENDIRYHGAGCIEPVSDPCQSCEMAHVITSQFKQIAELQQERAQWKAFAHQGARNAAYWREELTKLQNEALAEFKPLKEVAGHFFDEIRPFGPDEFKRPSEVAKCYKQVAPEKLLMSDDAKIICELLEGSGPMTSQEIAIRLTIRETYVLESLIEAREAGVVQLVDGKYQAARD
jgi:hypothetical protein